MRDGTLVLLSSPPALPHFAVAATLADAEVGVVNAAHFGPTRTAPFDPKLI